MNLKERLEKRYSVRNYLSDKVEREKLDYILECGRLAPSACNLQPWMFYVVTTEEGRASIQEAYQRDWFKTAPVYIIICSDYSQSWKRVADGKDHGDIDASIAIEHISLAAEELGLGTCWVCNFKPDILADYLGSSSDVNPVAILSLGYIDEQNSKIPEKRRKSAPEVIKWL